MKIILSQNISKIVLLILLFITFTGKTMSLKTVDKHPYHVGSVEFNYNSSTKTFEIAGKFFLDDLENALKQKYGKAVQFNNPKYKAEIDALLKDYCVEYIKLKGDGRFLTLKYIGFEEDSEAVHIYLESETLATPKKVETSVSFLYNFFDDQMNIVHIIIDGKRQSERLMYPNRYLGKSF